MKAKHADREAGGLRDAPDRFWNRARAPEVGLRELLPEANSRKDGSTL